MTGMKLILEHEINFEFKYNNVNEDYIQLKAMQLQDCQGVSLNMDPNVFSPLYVT